MNEKSFNYQENQQNYEIVRFGVKEHTIAKDIDKFYFLTMHRPLPSSPLYAILTNHEIVYLFNYKFGVQKSSSTNETMLSEFCEMKVNLRLEYKLPQLLHTKMKYSYNFECVFMLLANSQIAVFTDEFYLINCVDIICCDPQNSIKFCLDFEYYQKEASRSSRKVKGGYFAFLFADNLEIHEVQILTNHKMSNFKPSYKCSLSHISKRIVDDQIKHPAGLTLSLFFRSRHFGKAVEKTNNHIYLTVNCLREVLVYLINKETLSIDHTIKISKSQLSGAHVMDIEISPLNKRFLFALNNGMVRGISFKEQTFGQTSFSLKISDISVMKIYLQTVERLLTLSKDGSLSIVNLLTLSIEQKFKLGDSIQFHFVNEFHFLSAGSKSRSIYNTSEGLENQDDFSRLLILNEFNCKYEKIFEYNSEIVGYLLEERREIIQLTDNSLLVNSHHDNKVEVIQTYLPPRSVYAKCIQKNPFVSFEEYWILTEKSEIYKYNITQSKNVNVTEVVQLYRFIDRNETEHRYIITFFCFLTKIIPMEYDSQTTEKQYSKNVKTNGELKPICLGTNTGQVLITSIDSILNMICRMKTLSRVITNIIEVHPIPPSQPSAGLIIYESTKSQKVIVAELESSRHPVEHFRLSSRNGIIKSLSNELFAIINDGVFCIFYSKQCKGECQIYRQQHYNPGSAENSKITSISMCKIEEKSFILVGYSMGQILVYCLHHNVNEKTYIHLELLYLLENSKQQPVHFLRYENRRIYFNTGSVLLRSLLPEAKMKQKLEYIDQNHKLDKIKGAQQFNLSQRVNKPKKQAIHTTKIIQQTKEYKLPRVKEKNKSNRSSSVGVLKSDKSARLKPQFMFHFPDIQLYRNLINKTIIK